MSVPSSISQVSATVRSQLSYPKASPKNLVISAQISVHMYFILLITFILKGPDFLFFGITPTLTFLLASLKLNKSSLNAMFKQQL